MKLNGHRPSSVSIPKRGARVARRDRSPTPPANGYGDTLEVYEEEPPLPVVVVRHKRRRPTRDREDFWSPGTIVLLMLTAIFGLSGYALRPTASGPAPVPMPPDVALLLTQPPMNIDISAFLTEISPDNVHLVLSASSTTFPETATTVHWRLDIQNFTGDACSAQAEPAGDYKVEQTDIGGTPLQNSITVLGVSHLSAVVSGQIPLPFLTFSLCWHGTSPIVLRGSYLSASIPRVLSAGLSGTITRGLTLPGNALARYSIQGGIAPTSVTARNWVWTSNLSNEFNSQASSAIPIVSLDLSRVQDDSQKAFFSGISLGIAGSGAMACVPPIVGALARRRKRDDVPTDHDIQLA